MPDDYRSLHQYLLKRYADCAVLTLAQIEDLVGFPLPPEARTMREWWLNPDADDPEYPQSRAWILAGRTAMPNLRAMTVAFERH